MARVFVEIPIDTDNFTFSNREDAFNMIVGIENRIGEIEFTQRVYEYTRDILVNDGFLTEED